MCSCPLWPLRCPGRGHDAVPGGLDHVRGCNLHLPPDHQDRLYKIALTLVDGRELIEELPISLLWPNDSGPRRVHGNVYFTGY